jgi:hypothetical protein
MTDVMHYAGVFNWAAISQQVRSLKGLHLWREALELGRTSRGSKFKLRTPFLSEEGHMLSIIDTVETNVFLTTSYA